MKNDISKLTKLQFKKPDLSRCLSKTLTMNQKKSRITSGFSLFLKKY
jgi:hypothetical protein